MRPFPGQEQTLASLWEYMRDGNMGPPLGKLNYFVTY